MSTLGRIAAIAAGLTLLTLGASSAAAAEGSDNLWQVTATVTMEKPISMSLPAFTSETCAPPEAEQGPPPMKNGECSMDRFERDGDRVEFAMSCDMHGSTMHGQGWTEKTDADHYTGAMTMSGNVSGRPMQMSVAYSGTRIGHCTAEG